MGPTAGGLHQGVLYIGELVLDLLAEDVVAGHHDDRDPEVEYAQVKTARGRAHAEVLSEATAWAAIRKAAQAAIGNLPQMKPVPVASSYRFEVSYLNKLEADLAAGAAGQSERVDSLISGTPRRISCRATRGATT